MRWDRHAKRPNGEFPLYAAMALERLQLAMTEERRVCIAEIDEAYAGVTTAVAALYAMRLLLGGLVETLVQIDRALHIQERRPQAHVSLFPLFDPAISPRNFVIVALDPPADLAPP